MSKYRNKPCEIGGEKYRSQKEAKRHQELKLLQAGGQIWGLQREVSYVLAKGVKIGNRMSPPLRYVADFVYRKTGQVEAETPLVEDAKGFRTEGYRIKRHLMKAVHGIDILET